MHLKFVMHDTKLPNASEVKHSALSKIELK